MPAPKPATKSRLIRAAATGVISSVLAIAFRHWDAPTYLSWLTDPNMIDGLATFSGIAFAYVIHRKLDDNKAAAKDVKDLKDLL